MWRLANLPNSAVPITTTYSLTICAFEHWTAFSTTVFARITTTPISHNTLLKVDLWYKFRFLNLYLRPFFFAAFSSLTVSRGTNNMSTRVAFIQITNLFVAVWAFQIVLLWIINLWSACAIRFFNRYRFYPDWLIRNVQDILIHLVQFLMSPVVMVHRGV